MSLTITNSPVSALEPVYSPFYFRLISNLSNEPNFKYVYRISLINPVTNTITTQIDPVKNSPESDGSGVYSPARIIENYIGYNSFNPYSTGFTTNPDALLLYKVEFAEEYNVTGYTYSSVTNNAGYVQYNFNSLSSPTYLIGDKIKIEKTYKNYNLDYDGLQTITSVSSASITTDKVYGLSTTPESGSCISRLTYQSGITTTGQTWSGTKQYNQQGTDFSSYYILGDSTKRLLTDLSGDIRIGTNEVFTLSAIEPSTGSGCTGAVVLTYDSSNTTIGLFNITKSSSPYNMFNLNCGTYNLTNTVAYNAINASTEPIYNSNVAKYTVIVLSGATAISQTSTFVIDESCGYSDARLVWLNKMGGWSYQSFKMKSKRKTEINREFASKQLTYNYTIGDREEFVTGTRTNSIISLNSDYLTEAEGVNIENLLTSPLVYWCVNGNQTIHPVVVLTKDFIAKTIDDDGLISYSVDVRFAYSQNLQRN